jgi:hypothetical protein
MGFDRSKFKGAKVATLKNVQNDAKSNITNASNQDGRVSFLKIEEGKNIFRIMPPHPEDKIGASYLPKRTAMLSCEVPVYENGEITDKKEVKNKNIFIATQHGGLSKDPIELYINYVRQYAEDAIDDKEEKKKFLYPITGWRDTKGWNWGINPKTSYACYAIKDGALGRLELYESMIKEMDKLVAISEDSDDVMIVDPFSDPDEGVPLIITKQKNDKNKWEYLVSKDEPSRAKRESWDDFFKRVKITDKHLIELNEQKPLSELYGSDVYTKRDWDSALDGLKRFDEKNNFQIFENEDFVAELVELEKLVPEYKKPEENETKPETKKVETVEPKEEEDGLDLVSLPDMKRVLKSFIKKEFGEEYLDQFPKSRIDVEKWYSLYEEGEELPIVLNGGTPEDEVTDSKSVLEEDDEDVDESDSESEDEIGDEIAKMRNKRHKK